MTTSSSDTGAQPSKALHVALWVVQILLAFAFGAAGFTKATTPLEALAQQMPWVPSLPGALVRFIGVAEMLGALGLLLPAASRVQPRLTALAGAGLALVMMLAALLHMNRGEMGMLPVNIALGALAAFVAWGRATKAPIAPSTGDRR